MAKRKVASLAKSLKAFINEYDEAIEKEAYSNADIIEKEMNEKGYLKKAHKVLMDGLEIKSSSTSKYFDFEVFESMVKEKVALRKKRREEAEEKKRKEQEKLEAQEKPEPEKMEKQKKMEMR